MIFQSSCWVGVKTVEMLIPVLFLMVSVRTFQVDAGELDKSEKILAEFMRLQSDAANLSWDVEKSVELLRNIFIKRIRCGSLQSIHPKICEDCLSVPRIINITREADFTVDNRSDRGQNITRIQDLGHAAVIFLNYFLSFQTACTVESIRFGYVGSCRVYNQCLAELHHYISPMKSSSYAEVLETVEHFLREIKIVYEPEPSQPCFSTEKILDELRTRSERYQHMPREIATVLLITSHLYLGECIDVGESVADFLDDIFLHYGDGCERVITQSGFTKLYNDLQMQRKGKHIDHGVPQNPCAFRDDKSHYLHATKTEDSSHHKDPKTNGGKRNNTPNISTDSMKNETMSEDLVFENDLNYTLKATEPNFGSSSQDVSTRNVNQIQNKSRAAIWTPGGRLPVSSPFLESTSTVKVIPLTNDGTIYNVENITIQSEDEGGPQNTDLYHSYMTKNVTDKNLENIATKIDATSSKRTARHTISTEEHEHKNLANECLPSDDLLRRFLTNGNKVVTYAEFLQICPALVQQAVSGVCNSRHPINALSSEKTIFTGENETEVSLESAEAKGSTWHAVVSVSAITAASLVGLVMLPALNRPFYVYINGFFTGLAFGTMSGDVVLHIMPQYLGLHKHDEHGHEHEEESMLERYFPSHLQRQLTFWLTMYILFIAECIFSTLTGEKREHHGHSHDIPMKDMNVSSDVETANDEAKPPLCRRIVNFFKPSNICYGITSKAIVILLADTVHNFADGMAIAVGFSTSYKDGFSTSIAVFFHELPHEIGDFAVLLNSGLGYWRAFLFNLISGFSAFLGLGVGVFAASIFREWLLCITAGLFFFVVMGEMLPDMRLQSKEEWRVFIVKIVGTISGILTMICIAIYELSGV